MFDRKRNITNYFSQGSTKFVKLDPERNVLSDDKDVIDKISSNFDEERVTGMALTKCAADSKEKVKNDFVPPLLSVNSPLNWKLIQKENLNLKYVRLFPRQCADNIFHRLEKEIEYFSGDLLKARVFGKWHDIPRKQVSFGDEGLSYSFSGNCIPALPWPPLILEIKQAVENIMNYEFNFVLVNRYKDGTDYMGEHRDDEKDLKAEAPIASLSFGQPRDFIFKHKDSRGKNAVRKIDLVKIELEHGSLLIMNPPTNTYWYHSLPVRKKALNPRVNLTFRKMVEKTKFKQSTSKP